jgi:hypothetical protein
MKRIIDWYWNSGALRRDEHALSRGAWLDSIYGINARRDVLAALDSSNGVKHALGIWGPSQAGKSTLLSRYLDVGRTAEGSPCLTWDPAAPTVFLHHPGRPASTVVLNPFNNGSDASGCVTRYTLASEVKHPRHPVQVRFNSVGHIMHALACGYLSECRLEAADGTVVVWERSSVEKAFLSVRLEKGASVNRDAYELLREVLRIVDLFISARETRYRNLVKDWEMLRQDLLNNSQALRSVEDVVRLAKQLLWDDAASVSVTFDRLRDKATRLNWADGRIYCTTQVAGLLLDIDTFRRSSKSDLNEDDRRVAEAIGLLGFRRQAGDILIECGNESPDIARENFGLFQALVREIVVPVRKPAQKPDGSSAFFRLMANADLLDFPGVALQDGAASEASLINPNATPPGDNRWLTTVFKRGKTASMVLGYAQDVSIDSFALLVRAQDFPAKPKQLTSGIAHWWKCVDPAFDANEVSPGVKPPLPLSICLTFFAKVINQRQIGSGAGLESVFGDMLGKLAPLTLANNAQLFATTYKHFTSSGGNLTGTPDEIAKAADFITKDAAFRAAFRNDIARDSFKALIAEEDGGVEFFLEQQIASINASARRARLSAIDSADRLHLRDLLEEALPSGDDEGAAQSRVIRKFLAHVDRNRGGFEDPSSIKYKYDQQETADSLYSFWIRVMTYVDEADVEPVPTKFAEKKPEFRQDYVRRQWQRWRDSSVVRLGKTPGFHWNRFGLEGEAEGLMLLRFLSEQVGAVRLFDWVSEEMDDIESESVARSMRRELAVAMGNIIRHGTHHLAVVSRPDALTILRDQASRRRGDTSIKSAHDISILDGFLGLLRSFKPAMAKRPPQPGDDELRQLRAQF